MITRKMVNLVQKSGKQWWVYLGDKRIGLVAKTSHAEGPWLARELGFNTKPILGTSKEDALNRLIMKLNGK